MIWEGFFAAQIQLGYELQNAESVQMVLATAASIITQGMSILRQNHMVQKVRTKTRLLIFLESNHLVMALVRNLLKFGSRYSQMLLTFMAIVLLQRELVVFSK